MARQLCGTKIELDLRPVTLPHSYRGNIHTRLYTHTHSLSLSLFLSHAFSFTLSYLISANCKRAGEGRLDSFRPSASLRSNFRLVVTLFTFIHFYSAFISTFSAVTNPLRPHAFIASQPGYVCRIPFCFASSAV